MATDTLDDFPVTNQWQDIVATTAAAGGIDLMLQNIGLTTVSVIQGGTSAPAATKSGRLMRSGENLYVSNAHLWVMSIGGSSGLVSVNPL